MEIRGQYEKLEETCGKLEGEIREIIKKIQTHRGNQELQGFLGPEVFYHPGLP